MKLISKDALILGGWAVALEAPLSYLPQEGIISDIIFVIDTAFFICLLFLLFNKVPSFIQKTKEKLPTLAFLLSCIGWYAYVHIFIGIGGMIYLFQNEERLEDIAFLTQMNNFMTYVSYFFTTLVALSFLGGVIYLIKKKNKKEKTIG